MSDAQLAPKSPLELKHHLFTLVRVEANPGGMKDGPSHMDQNIRFSRVAGQSNQWNLELGLKLVSENAEKPFYYSLELNLIGMVEVIADFPEEKKEQLAVTNGLSILYGAAREMVINLTARSVYGPIVLPSTSFASTVKLPQ